MAEDGDGDGGAGGAGGAGAGGGGAGGGVHDMPSAAGLVEAVREFLERDVMPAVEGRVQFHTRVAVNVLGMVARELEVGAAQAAVHASGLAALGVSSEGDLAAMIRDMPVDDPRLDEVARFVRSTVRAKLEVANPKYLETGSGASGPQGPGSGSGA